MDRPKRAATKVTDFRKYHLSGDLNKHIRGQVDSNIRHFEMVGAVEELKKQLEAEKEHSKKLEEEAECMKVQQELDAEKLRQKQWQVAMKQIKEAWEHAEKEHAQCIEKIKEMAVASREEVVNNTAQWFQAQVNELNRPHKPEEQVRLDREREAREAREAEIKDLRVQQEAINKKLLELTEGDPMIPAGKPDSNGTSQALLMDQLRTALSGKKEEDPNKALLRALVTNQNKMGAEGGINTLKPNLLHGILGGDTGNSMAD